MILFMGMFGAYLLYNSGKAATPKSQWAYLGSGFIVLTIALMVAFFIVKIKTGA